MIERKHFRASLLVAALALAAGPVAAQTDAVPAPMTTPTGVRYISGGVGAGQQQAMKDVMKDYNLRLTFAQQGGDYLASVKVTIDQTGGKMAGAPVLDAVSNGPMLFAKLPAGKYRVHAAVDDQVQVRTVDVGEGRAQDLVVHFPAK